MSRYGWPSPDRWIESIRTVDTPDEAQDRFDAALDELADQHLEGVWGRWGLRWARFVDWIRS